jgi:hypothetical protein
MRNSISLLSLFFFSNPPSPPFFQRGDDKDAKCPPSRGYHTKRHRAAKGSPVTGGAGVKESRLTSGFLMD